MDPDTRRAAQIAVFGRVPREHLWLRGTVNWESNDSSAQAAEVDGTLLYLGERDGVDATPLVLQIEQVSAGAFRGTWHDPESGIGVRVDITTQKQLPNAAGTFCAARIRER